MQSIEGFFKEHVDRLGKPNSSGWSQGRCPFHEDKASSLSINLQTGGWKCFAGCGKGSIFDFAAKRGVIYAETKKPVKSFDYGPYRKVLYSDKSYGFVRESEGKQIHNLEGVAKNLYRLGESLGSAMVFIVEGEKCVDYLFNEGFIATTPGSSASWQDEFAIHFIGKAVILWPDNDKPGEQFAQTVLKSLTGKAAMVKILKFEHLPKGGDAEDYFLMGGTKEELQAKILDLMEEDFKYVVSRIKEIDIQYEAWTGRAWNQIKTFNRKMANNVLEARDAIDEVYVRCVKHGFPREEIDKALENYKTAWELIASRWPL